MASTRVVVALMAGSLFVGSIVALRMERPEASTWLQAVGSGLGTLWAVLSFYWAADNASMATPGSFLALAATGALLTLFLFFRALEGRPLG